MTKRFSLFAGLALAAATVSAPALAHIELVRSNPAANATLKTSPQRITLQFDKRLAAKGGLVELSMPEHGGMKVPVRTVLSPDGKRLVASFAKPLSAGAYKINWTAAGLDGHVFRGDLAFKVG